VAGGVFLGPCSQMPEDVRLIIAGTLFGVRPATGATGAGAFWCLGRPSDITASGPTANPVGRPMRRAVTNWMPEHAGGFWRSFGVSVGVLHAWDSGPLLAGGLQGVCLREGAPETPSCRGRDHIHGCAVSGGPASVTMVEAADLRNRQDSPHLGRLRRSRFRRLLGRAVCCGQPRSLLCRALQDAELVTEGEVLQMECGSGLEDCRRGGGQSTKCAERQTQGLTEDTQPPCSHVVRGLR
jgi:hypothetical protein